MTASSPNSTCHVCDKDLGVLLDNVWEPICDDCYEKARAEIECRASDGLGQCRLTKGHGGPHLDPSILYHFDLAVATP